VSNTLGGGFAEKVYQNAVIIEIEKNGLHVQRQFPFAVKYDGIVFGDFFADLLVEELVLVELKAVKILEDVHIAQCLNYLRATGLPMCLLINFYRPNSLLTVFIRGLLISECSLYFGTYPLSVANKCL
jgi:GxxExxY protein